MKTVTEACQHARAQQAEPHEYLKAQHGVCRIQLQQQHGGLYWEVCYCWCWFTVLSKLQGSTLYHDTDADSALAVLTRWLKCVVLVLITAASAAHHQDSSRLARSG
jgi:hypothetical protein